MKTLAEVEKEHLIAAMEKAEGNRTLAAELIGITFHTLCHRLKKHGLPAGKPGRKKRNPELSPVK